MIAEFDKENTGTISFEGFLGDSVLVRTVLSLVCPFL
jgi:hypothetical protein